MGGSENPWDTALVMKPPLVPEQEKFLPAHLGRDGLPEGCPPSQEWRGVGGRDAGVADSREIFQSLPLSGSAATLRSISWYVRVLSTLSHI